MRFFKSVFSYILVMVLFVTSCPAVEITVFADDAKLFEYVVLEDGTIEITDYNDNGNSRITIPETIDGYTVTVIGVQAFYDHDTVSGVSIPGSVRIIKSKAFANCDNLYDIIYSMSNNYTGCSISSDAFSGSLAYTTTLKNANMYMEYICKNLGITEATSDYNKVSLVFNWLKSTASYDFSILNGGAHTALSDDICGLAMGHDLSCSGFATSFRKIMKYLGIECRYIEGYCTGTAHAWNLVNLDGYWYHLDASGAGHLKYYPFLVSTDTIKEYCSSFEDFAPYAPYDYGDSVPYLESDGIYYTLKSDSTVSIKHYNVYAEEIIIPEYIDGHLVSEIGDEAFVGSNATKITLPQSIKKIGDGAFKVSCIKKVDFPDNVDEIGEDAFLWSEISEVILPDKLTTLKSHTLRNCFYLNKICFNKNLQLVEYAAISCNGNCTFLIPDGNTVFEADAIKHMYGNKLTLTAYHPQGAEIKSLKSTESVDIEKLPFENKLISMTVNKISAVIDEKNKTVSVQLLYGPSFEDISIELSVSEHATYEINKHADFSRPVKFKVVSYDGVVSEYTLNISLPNVCEHKFTYEQVKPNIINLFSKIDDDGNTIKYQKKVCDYCGTVEEELYSVTTPVGSEYIMGSVIGEEKDGLYISSLKKSGDRYIIDDSLAGYDVVGVALSSEYTVLELPANNTFLLDSNFILFYPTVLICKNPDISFEYFAENGIPTNKTCTLKTLVGYKGSTAEKFAAEHGFMFADIEDNNYVNTICKYPDIYTFTIPENSNIEITAEMTRNWGELKTLIIADNDIEIDSALLEPCNELSYIVGKKNSNAKKLADELGCYFVDIEDEEMLYNAKTCYKVSKNEQFELRYLADDAAELVGIDFTDVNNMYNILKPFKKLYIRE